VRVFDNYHNRQLDHCVLGYDSASASHHHEEQHCQDRVVLVAHVLRSLLDCAAVRSVVQHVALAHPGALGHSSKDPWTLEEPVREHGVGLRPERAFLVPLLFDPALGLLELGLGLGLSEEGQPPRGHLEHVISAVVYNPCSPGSLAIDDNPGSSPDDVRYMGDHNLCQDVPVPSLTSSLTATSPSAHHRDHDPGVWHISYSWHGVVIYLLDTNIIDNGQVHHHDQHDHITGDMPRDYPVDQHG